MHGLKLDDGAIYLYLYTMKRLNPRVARSRKKLGEALVSLILEQGLENLSITAVLKRSNVGRATFYRHFRNLDELLTYTLQTTMHELAEALRQEETFYDETVALFRFIKENQELFRVYVDLPDSHPVRIIVKEEAITIVIEQRWEARSTSPVPMDVSVNHLIESTYTFIRWHLNNINDFTPEQVAVIYDDLVIAGAEFKALSRRRDSRLHPPGQQED